MSAISLGRGRRRRNRRAIPGPNFSTQRPHRFVRDLEPSSFGQQLLDITIAQSESGDRSQIACWMISGAPALWRRDNRGVPFVGLILHPALKLLGGTAQDIAADRIEPPIGREKAHDPLGLLKGLDEPVQHIRSKHR
jgi:hypothetical protein